MKKLLSGALGLALLCGLGFGTSPRKAKGEAGTQCVVTAQSCAEKTTASGLELRAKAAYLMEYGTKTAIHAENELTHLPIASMCKIMTLLLSLEGIDDGTITLDEGIRISERAASMGGSQVFLEANATYPVRELIKSIVVCSANDSCVAMAERLAGSESLFVEKMNARAKELGANDTLFANCTGLPKEPQYSCAKDVAFMLKALLSHDLYYEFGKVWLDKFAHPQGRYTEITNTNKLVRFYDGCDGGKTGFTNEAGFCLAATAKRGDMRIISVVIGEENSANRFNDVRTMFDYAFANYTNALLYEREKPINGYVKVQGGKEEQVELYPARSAYSFCKRGEKGNITCEVQVTPLKAPFKEGTQAGELLLFQDGVEYDRIPLLTCEGVQKANLFDRFRQIAKEWNG